MCYRGPRFQSDRNGAHGGLGQDSNHGLPRQVTQFIEDHIAMSVRGRQLFRRQRLSFRHAKRRDACHCFQMVSVKVQAAPHFVHKFAIRRYQLQQIVSNGAFGLPFIQQSHALHAVCTNADDKYEGIARGEIISCIHCILDAEPGTPLLFSMKSSRTNRFSRSIALAALM